MFFGPTVGKENPNISLAHLNLGVLFYPSLKFEQQINSVIKSCFFYLTLLSKIKFFLSFKDLERDIHAFIFSRLDYCNSLYIGLPQFFMSRLQMIENAAARFLTGVPKQEHVMLILASLNWLPVRYNVEFKILLFVFKSLNSLVPSYLSIR